MRLWRMENLGPERRDRQPLNVSPPAPPAILIDGRPWRRMGFSTQLACEDCGIEYPTPEPRLYSFNSPLGACPECEGFGNVIGIDMDLIVPDPAKSLRDGAIAPWNTPAYAHELKELLALAGDYDLPLDVPFRDLTEPQSELILHGVPERNFGGLEGFLRLAGTAEVQNAHPRVPEPLAQLSAVPGLRRHAVAAGGAWPRGSAARISAKSAP